jgi:hypothetical protein
MNHDRLRAGLAAALALAAATGCGRAPRPTAEAAERPAAALPAAGPADTALASRWPEHDLAAFAFAHLDLTTFRNSTGDDSEGPRARTFAELGIRPTEVSDTIATSEADGWHYSVSVLGRGDYNKDGVEEVAVCFLDWARNGGTYRARFPLTLALISGRAVAIDYEVYFDEADLCEREPSDG